MTTTVSPTDAQARRADKAAAILEGASQWGRGRLADGTRIYLVPSCSRPGVYYATDTERCGCPDDKRRAAIDPLAAPCKHALAARWYVARLLGFEVNAQPPRRSPEQLAALRALVANE